MRHPRNATKFEWLVYGLPLLTVVILLGCGGDDGDSGGGSGRPSRRELANSMNQLKHIGLALHNYHDTFRTFPPGGIFDAKGKGHHSWQAMILPFIEERPLHRRIDFNKPWDHAANQTAMKTVVKAYLIPRGKDDALFGAGRLDERDSRGYGLSHYAGNSYIFGKWPADKPFGRYGRRVRDVTDGLANTLLAGEVADGPKPWGDPTNYRDPAKGLNKGPDTFGRPGGYGAIFVFCDGSIRHLNNDVDPQVLKSLATHSGGEAIPDGY